MAMNYFCCTNNRRQDVKAHPVINGIDFLEVSDNPADADADRQTTLYVHFIKAITPGSIQEEQVIIEGGERIRNVNVISITEGLLTSPITPDAQNILVVKTDVAGDFSTYTLRLVQDTDSKDTLQGYDPVLSSVDFSFKVLCPSDFDCQPAHNCAPATEAAPEINYLAKDFSSFRRIMLDRMALLMPQWRERNPADLGITLVELLAYAGDYLSYHQDAIVTEAYLGTARKRISVRRHARLVDYFMHDGCNARTWVHITAGMNVTGALLQKQNSYGITRVLSRTSVQSRTLRTGDADYVTALNEGAVVFELMHDLALYYLHNEMQFYTWSQTTCWLCKGATSATLLGHFPDLQPGMVLILAEVLGPETGDPADADPLHRYPVRLTEVLLTEDPIGKPITSPYTDTSLPVTKITWDDADALPAPLCISSKNNNGSFAGVSVAWGNNVLADHGFTINEQLPRTPEAGQAPGVVVNTAVSPCDCEVPEPAQYTPRFNPAITYGPVTQPAPYGHPASAAYTAMHWSMRDPLPAITLQEPGVDDTWYPQRDLLKSKPADLHFVMEVEADGVTTLRFGDGIGGHRPPPETSFMAVYRIGNGLKGNIGADVLYTLVSDDPAVTGANAVITDIRNPLPGSGGMEPESMDMVKQKAPVAFRTQERAVTLADYEEVSKRCSQQVQRSAATFRWTGSWRTVFLTVDRLGGESLGTILEQQLGKCIERYRLAGHDLEINTPQYVSLEIKMEVCVKRDYFTGPVKAALLDVFSNKELSNGQTGIFHPDNFTFGQTVYLSPIYAAAQQVAGVDAIHITIFQRQGKPLTSALNSGKLILAPLEIARLDNDPNFPERGVFNLVMQGGR